MNNEFFSFNGTENGEVVIVTRKRCTELRKWEKENVEWESLKNFLVPFIISSIYR